MVSLTLKTVTRSFQAREQSEGHGAKVRRSIGGAKVRNFTPFLMLDHFKAEPSPDSGFPDHPHRGQETISYIISGHIDHEDFTGSSGSLGPGDLQFMTAGRGIVHSEMPRVEMDEDGNILTIEGLQLWVDLPEELKYCVPRYRDLRAAEIPIIHPNPKVEIKIISGESHGTASVKDLAYTPIWFLDMKVQPGGRVEQPVPKGFNTFLYVMDGQVSINGKVYPQFETVFFDVDGDGVEVLVPEDSQETARFVIISGQILDQPIVQYGPFVATSKEKIMEAFMDYQTGANGFEKAIGWESKIGQRILKYF